MTPARYISPIGRSLLLILVAVILLSGLIISGSAEAAPRCFGAASMDGCKNRQLAGKVMPSIAFARQSEWGIGHLRNLKYCLGKKIEQIDGLAACRLGSANPSKVLALVGDSHSAHWRPAMSIIAKQRGIQVISLMEGGCEYNVVGRRRFGLSDPISCDAWRAALPAWFAKHSEIKTAFFSGVSYEATYQSDVPDFLTAYNLLPASLKQLIVIRDNPRAEDKLYDCIEAAQQSGRRPGRACALRRSQSLMTDYSAIAVKLSGRGQVIDLSRLFCSSRLCYPVIGGSLVYAQGSHQAPGFNETLAPYLNQAISQIGLAK